MTTPTEHIERAKAHLLKLLECQGYREALADPDDTMTEWVGPRIHAALRALDRALQAER